LRLSDSERELDLLQQQLSEEKDLSTRLAEERARSDGLEREVETLKTNRASLQRDLHRQGLAFEREKAVHMKEKLNLENSLDASQKRIEDLVKALAEEQKLREEEKAAQWEEDEEEDEEDEEEDEQKKEEQASGTPASASAAASPSPAAPTTPVSAAAPTTPVSGSGGLDYSATSPEGAAHPEENTVTGSPRVAAPHEEGGQTNSPVEGEAIDSKAGPTTPTEGRDGEAGEDRLGSMDTDIRGSASIGSPQRTTGSADEDEDEILQVAKMMDREEQRGEHSPLKRGESARVFSLNAGQLQRQESQAEKLAQLEDGSNGPVEGQRAGSSSSPGPSTGNEA